MKLKKEIMNKIVASMAKNQNSKSKMNAGQLREAASLFVKAMLELSESDKLEFVSKLAGK